ncbi:MAG: threonine aldolase [Oscillospiraceae bacterium]|nr:MAG: threonine aldolase [Oscillospiraceae bacterium]
MIDLRSDTLTMPDLPMLETILTAPLGDDGRVGPDGRGEDATVNELEDLAARLTGKEAALLFPTGTLANTCGVLAWSSAGDPVLVHEQQHLLLTEKFLFDDRFCRMKPVRYRMTPQMVPDAEQIDRLFAESGARLLCLENSHNFSGGYCIPVDQMRRLREVADRHHASIHLDGARLFHAAASLGVTVDQIAAYTDTVMFCISKGLGAPVGSLLCGSREVIARVRPLRHLLGGGMRQAGVIAAPGLWALRHNLSRLQEDIDNARLAAGLLQGKLTRLTMQKEVQTNLLVLGMGSIGVSPDEFCRRAAEKGLLIRPVLSDSVRLVFYKGVTKEDARGAARILLELDREL